jgi:tetratricopeptide (TPR) repeat protein
VHLLANRHLAELEAFLVRLARSEEPRAAWAACCAALTPRVLDQEAADYVRGAAYTSLRVPLPPIAPRLHVRTLHPAEARATQARLQAMGESGSEEARTQAVRLAREALALDGADPLAALTLCDLLGYEAPDCLQAARAAAREHPGDPRPFLLLVLALPPNQGQERVEAVERAVALAPEHPVALVAVAKLRLAQGRPREALEAGRRAAQNAPGQVGPLVAMSRAREALGECKEALSLEERVLELLPEAGPSGLAPGVRERNWRLRHECRELPNAEGELVESRRLACARAGPRVPLESLGKEARVVRFHYRVREDGAVSEPTAPDGAPPGLVEAVRDYLRACRHAPATRGGRPVAVEVEESFTIPARPAP